MNINERLNDVAARAGFTITDMATWCGFDKETMRMWMRENVQPHPLREEHLLDRIKLAEKVIHSGEGLPVPVTIRQYDRKKYVSQVRDNALGISNRRPSGKRS